MTITQKPSERGNVLFMILLAIVLIGGLTAAIMQGNNSEGANIDKETLAVRASEVQRHAAEIERAVGFVLNNGYSEVDIRFAHYNAPSSYGDLSADSDTTDQVFARDGGAATYRSPPEDILASTPQYWEFYAGTALPQVGTSKPDLVAVLPNVTAAFCTKINDLNGQTTLPEDTGATHGASGSSAGDCIDLGDDGRFGNSETYYDSGDYTPNTTDETTFAKKPAPQACLQCADGSYHFYHVLKAR